MRGTRPRAPQPAQAGRRRRRLWRVLGVVVLVLTLAGGLLLMDAWTSLGRTPRGARLERIERSPNHVDGRFVNALEPQMSMGRAMWKWIRGGQERTPTSPIPVVELDAADLAEASPGVRSTWMGHSTVLLELEGRRFLTDPVWSEQLDPSIFGPKRFFAPPIALESLPPLDAVLISHDHFDHLDMRTIQRLEARQPVYIVPLGVGEHLEYWGVDGARVRELDWWDRTEVSGIQLVCTPARHFSGRSLPGRDKTLWAGWALLGGTHRIYFSGDSGMFPGFREIGERLGPFDLTLVEAGAYDESWADVHLGPEQAVDAHLAVGGGLMQPLHWGTFNLALHSWTEPAERLMVAAEQAGVRLVVPRPGERVEAASPPELSRWWPDIPWQTAEAHPVVSSGLAQTSQREHIPETTPTRPPPRPPAKLRALRRE